MELSLPLTVILLIVSGLFTLFCGWRGARMPDLRKAGPRMVPWRFLMLMGAAVTILMIVHLLTMLGLKTDPPNQF